MLVYGSDLLLLGYRKTIEFRYNSLEERWAKLSRRFLCLNRDGQNRF